MMTRPSTGPPPMRMSALTRCACAGAAMRSGPRTREPTNKLNRDTVSSWDKYRTTVRGKASPVPPRIWLPCKGFRPCPTRRCPRRGTTAGGGRDTRMGPTRVYIRRPPTSLGGPSGVPHAYKVSVCKEYLSFSSAHFITLAGHQCESLHGHNYRVGVTVEGDLDPECAFVVDFAVLKRIVRPHVQAMDHRVLLPTANSKLALRELGDRLVV